MQESPNRDLPEQESPPVMEIMDSLDDRDINDEYLYVNEVRGSEIQDQVSKTSKEDSFGASSEKILAT